MIQHLVHKLQGKEREQASIFSHLLLVNPYIQPLEYLYDTLLVDDMDIFISKLTNKLLEMLLVIQ